MTGKRQELRAGNFIYLTKLDTKIINILGTYLMLNKKAILTELYEEVDKKKRSPVNRCQVKYCLMIMYIRRKITITNWKKPWQKRFRTIIKWTGK